MATRLKHIWYVSFEMPRAPIGGKQPYSRKTSTFQSEDEAKNFARACGHLSQASAQTKCNPARKFRAVFSYRVAIARKCLIMQKNRSTRLRSQYSAKSQTRFTFR